MWFGEPHPFPERGLPTRLSASGQQSYDGWSCIVSMGVGSNNAAEQRYCSVAPSAVSAIFKTQILLAVIYNSLLSFYGSSDR